MFQNAFFRIQFDKLLANKNILTVGSLVSDVNGLEHTLQSIET